MRAVASHGRNYFHLPRMIKSTMISPLRKDQGRKGKEHRQGGSPIFSFAKKKRRHPQKTRSNKGFFPPFFGRNHWNPPLFSGYLQHGFRVQFLRGFLRRMPCGSDGKKMQRMMQCCEKSGEDDDNRRQWMTKSLVFFLWSKSRWISGTPSRHQP